MGNFFSKILVFYFLMVASYTSSQENSDIPEPNQMPIVKLDLDTGILSSSFPFDRFFKLEISTKKYEIAEKVYVFNVQYQNIDYLKFKGKVGNENKFIYQKNKVRQLYPNKRAENWKTARISYMNVCGQGDFDDFINRKKDSIIIARYSREPIVKKISDVETEINFETKRLNAKSLSAKATLIKKQTYQIVIDPLKPAQLYEIVLRKIPSDNELKSLFNIIDLIDSTKICKAKKLYDAKIYSLESSARRLSAPKFLKNYVGFTKVNLDSLKTIIDIREGELKNSYQTQIAGDLKAIVQEMGKKLADNKFDVEDFSISYGAFLNLEPSELEEIYLGRRKLGNDTVVEAYDRTKRLNILRHNLSIMDATKMELQKLSIVDSAATIQDFINKDFFERRKLILDNTIALSKLYDEASSYMKGNFQYSSLISASTIDADIKTRNARVIVTDFGIMGSFAYNNSGEVKLIPRPFTGINLHFGGGIDKDQKLDHILRKRFWHRYSLAIGVTIGKIDESGFSDFFNGLSPMVGMNYRLHEQIRAGAGVFWIREENANPLIERKPIEPAVYLSISFDFNLFEQIGKLATKVIN